MTVQELRAAKVDLLETIQTRATKPLPTPDDARKQVERIFVEVEGTLNGKEEARTAPG